jgi:biopolymer transport protein ExbD
MKDSYLQFSQHLKKPSFALDGVPYISVGALALFTLFAANSLFVSHGPSMSLIGLASDHGAPDRPPNAVLTIYDPSTIFFEGRILSITGLKSVMSDFVRQQQDQEVYLLVRSNRILSLEQMQQIWDALNEAGVHRVIMEAESIASRSSNQ